MNSFWHSSFLPFYHEYIIWVGRYLGLKKKNVRQNISKIYRCKYLHLQPKISFLYLITFRLLLYILCERLFIFKLDSFSGDASCFVFDTAIMQESVTATYSIKNLNLGLPSKKSLPLENEERILEIKFVWYSNHRYPLGIPKENYKYILFLFARFFKYTECKQNYLRLI